MNTSEYVVRFRAEISNFKQNLERAKSSMKQVEQQGGTLKSRIQSQFSKSTKSTESFRASFQKTSKTVSSATSGMISGLKKLASVVIAAFSVRAVIQFGKECLNAASKLNAMTAMSNKAFGEMSEDVQKWAKSASTSYGLSQRMALQYTSTLGSMARGFGFTTEEAVTLSETIAGRIGDLASYYSITQDEAYNKMNAIFTGETESLKSLGIVMTQTALDSYALANGFGKTTAQMTEQEKVILRYKFLMDQTKLAEGDFMDSTARGSWGNQIRRLKLQIEDFKTSVGQGLIVVLTPVISLLNTLMGKLVSVGNAFADLMAKISGKDKKAVSSVVPAVSDLGKTVSDTAETATDMAKQAGQDAKKASKTIASFDQLHILSNDEDKKTDQEEEKENSPAIDGIKTDLQDTTSETKDATSAFDGLIQKAKELQKVFEKGFKIGLGSSTFEPILDNIKKVKEAFKNIFTDPKVVDSANKFINKMVKAWGQVVGSVTSIGITIATALTGGIAQYLEKNTERIKNYLISMFDVGGKVVELSGNFATAVAEIFSVFADENGITAISNLFGIIFDSVMGATEIISKFALDVQTLIMKPIIDNVDGLKKVLDGLLGFIGRILGTIKDTVDATVDKALTVYDEHVHPLFESLTNGISTIIRHLTEAWEQYIQPLLDFLAEKVDVLFKEHIQPVIDSLLDLLGQIMDSLKALWEGVLLPFITWIIDNIIPVVAPIIKEIGSVVLDVAGGVMDAIKLVIDVAKYIIKFITDVFKGDWKSAWEDVKKIGETIWKGIKNIITGFIKKIQEYASKAWKAIQSTASSVFNGIRKTASSVWGKIKSVISTAINGAKTAVATAVNNIKSNVSTQFNKVKSTVQSVWNAINNHIKEKINNAKKVVSNSVTVIKDKATTAFNSVRAKTKEHWDKIEKYINDSISDAKKTVGSAVKTIKEKAINSFNTVKSKTQNAWKQIGNSIINNINSAKKSVKSAVQTLKEDALDKFRALREKVKTIWNKIKSLICDPIANAKKSVESAVNSIKSIMSFDGITESINNALGGSFGDVFKALTAPFYSALDVINDVKEAIQNFNPLSAVQSIGNSIGGVFGITTHATGGFPEDGIFMANHNELVGKFSNGKNVVANNMQIIEGIEEGVASAIAPFMLEMLTAVKQNKKTGDNVIEIDGERFARIMTKYQKRIYMREVAF